MIHIFFYNFYDYHGLKLQSQRYSKILRSYLRKGFSLGMNTFTVSTLINVLIVRQHTLRQKYYNGRLWYQEKQQIIELREDNLKNNCIAGSCNPNRDSFLMKAFTHGQIVVVKLKALYSLWW